jgi:hypothetical protein
MSSYESLGCAQKHLVDEGDGSNMLSDLRVFVYIPTADFHVSKAPS